MIVWVNDETEEPMNSYRYEDEYDVREAFWDTMPIRIRLQWYDKRQNQCPADVRTAFVDFVDYLQKSSQISEELADTVTL